MMQAAIMFRGKVWIGEYHADCMHDALADCGQDAAAEMDAGAIEFGYWQPSTGFRAMPAVDQRVREDWYGNGDFVLRPISLSPV